MKQLIKMKKEKMSLSDRIAYVKAIEKMELALRLINQCDIIYKQ